MLSRKLVTLLACLCLFDSLPPPFPISCSPHPSRDCIDLVCRHVGELKGGEGNLFWVGLHMLSSQMSLQGWNIVKELVICFRCCGFFLKQGCF